MTEQLIPEYDKSKWRKGEWDNEPDRVDFIQHGFACFILRNQLGNWCGYVGVPENHPYYLVKYQDVDGSLDVHGGLTYSDVCVAPICHIPEPGMPDNVWWFGFDTAHYMDESPYDFGSRMLGHGVYRNMEYTMNETKHLADQLAALYKEK